MNKYLKLMLVLCLIVAGRSMVYASHRINLIFDTPYPSISNTSIKGNVAFPLALDRIKLGNLFIPIYLVFCTTDNGTGWTFPIENSRAFLLNEEELCVVFPSGYECTLTKSTNNTWIYNGLFLPYFPSGNIIATKRNNAYEINISDKLCLIFRKGKLFEITSENGRFVFNRQNTNEFVIKERGNTVLSILRKKRKIILRTENKEYVIYYSKNKNKSIEVTEILDNGNGNISDFSLDTMLNKFTYRLYGEKEKYIIWGNDGQMQEDEKFIYNIEKNTGGNLTKLSRVSKATNNTSVIYFPRENIPQRNETINNVETLQYDYIGGNTSLPRIVRARFSPTEYRQIRYIYNSEGQLIQRKIENSKGQTAIINY